MSATRCTCIRDERLVRLVIDEFCPAFLLHVIFTEDGRLTKPLFD